MARYAKATTVTVAKSKAEIEHILTRYGARQFYSGWDEGEAIALVGFTVLADDGTPRQVRLRLPLPVAEEYATAKKAEQAERSAWRALALVCKAKLEAVESGISTIEREFMSDIVLPNGSTLGEWAEPQIAKLYAGGAMPKLLGGR